MSQLFKRSKSKAGGSGANKSFFRGGGGGGFWGAKRSYSGANSRQSGNSEKLIFVELVGENTISVRFENFFDLDIKEKVKCLPDAKYDGASKEWFLRKDLMDTLFQSIGEVCIEKGVRVVEIPDFVFDLAKNSIPFSGKAHTGAKDVKAVMSFGKEFNYENEAKGNRY